MIDIDFYVSDIRTIGSVCFMKICLKCFVTTLSCFLGLPFLVFLADGGVVSGCFTLSKLLFSAG